MKENPCSQQPEAKPVTVIHSCDYEGPVCADRHGERYFSDWAEFLDQYEGNRPEAFACHLVPVHLDADDILMHRYECEMDIPEDHHLPNIFSHIDELKEFLADWNARQTYRYWMVDPTRVIIAGGAR